MPVSLRVIAAYLSQRGSLSGGGTPATGSYVVREEDGTSKLTLEEGGGSILTEEST